MLGSFKARRTSTRRYLCVLTAMLLMGMVLPVSAQDVDNPFTSYFVGTAPVVDGTISPGEYPGPGVTISTANSFNVDWGGSNPQVAPEDCSFTVYSVWTNEALYFAVDVTDDEIGLSDGGWATGDFVQIVLAEVGAQARQAGSLADFAYTSNDGPIWRNNAGGGDINWGNANITPEFAATSNGYVLEVRFPWSDFNFNLPTLEDGAQLKCMITVVDVDPGKEGQFNAFVISSGGPSANPFENHQDISLLTLVAEAPEPEPLVWDFCDGLQGWAMANQSPVAWDGSRMVVTQSATAPTTYDPHIQAAGLDHDLVAFPHLAMKFTVENAPRPFTIGFFSWRDTGGFFRPQVTNIGNGEHLVRIDYAAQFSGTDEWGARLTALRMDIPDNEPHVDGGAWPDFQDMVVTIDWIAFSDDPEFEAGPCPVVVNISGPGMVVQGSDVTLWADVTGNVGDVSYQWWKDGQELPGETNNYLELLAVTEADSGLYAVAVTDDNDTVIVTHNLKVVEALPITGYLGLILLVVAASMSGFALLRRQTT